MEQPIVTQAVASEIDDRPNAQLVQSALRLILAVRYRKNLVAAVMTAVVLLGGLYYATAPRKYASKAALLITQTKPDRLDTSITNDESVRQNTMPTFENIARSATVIEGALKNLSGSDLIDLRDLPRKSWVNRIKAGITAKAIRSTNVLEVNYQSKDPQVAANVVRALVQSFIEFIDRNHRGTAGELIQSLTKERTNLSEKLARKREELLEARRQFSDMDVGSDIALHPMVKRAVDFNDALIAAQKKRVEFEALLFSLQTAIANGDDLGQYMISVGDVVGREMLLSSLGLGNRESYTQASLEKGLLEDRAALHTALQNLGPNHPEVVALTGRVRMTEEYLASAQQRITQRLSEINQSQLGAWLMGIVRQKRDEALQQEKILAYNFEQTRAEAVNLSGQLAHLEMLEREVERMNNMDTVLFNQIASLDLRQNGQDVRVTETEPPVVNGNPVSPRLSMVAALVVLGGLGASLGLVTLLDALDDRFRSIEEMQSRLGLPILTMVQHLEAPESTGPRALITHALPVSTASESFRTLRTALTLTHADARQIVVTSAEPGDGKTTVLANLAVTYAQADKRTLLIDADLRRPGLTNLMDMRGPHGLSEILRSELDIGQMAKIHIRPSGVEGLDIIPSGPRPTDPAELLGSPRLSQLLAWAETVYDQILIDSPPTLATTDTAIIGRLVDGVILVVQPAKNRRRLVTRVIERLELMKIPLLGLVVNRTGNEADQSYYGYHSYGYGYGYGYGYTSEYGHDESSTTPEEDIDGNEPAPVSSGTGRSRRDDDDSGTLTIPRRVA